MRVTQTLFQTAGLGESVKSSYRSSGISVQDKQPPAVSAKQSAFSSCFLLYEPYEPNEHYELYELFKRNMVCVLGISHLGRRQAATW